MGAKVTLVAEGDALDENTTEQELASINGAQLERTGPERGIGETTVKIVRWIFDFAGDISKVADALVKVAENQPAGVEIKVKYGNREIKVSNVNRDQVAETLSTLHNMAQTAEEL
jgi:hypothetical protein